MTDQAVSDRMRRVRRRDTQPEVTLRKALWHRGARYRLHVRSLPGTPDIVFPRAKVAVFVHGCFWHRHPGCRSTTTPKRNADFWMAKFHANVDRDARKVRQLEELGWRVAVVWSCETRSPEALDRRVWEIVELVGRSDRATQEVGRIPHPTAGAAKYRP